ncbi:MAG TPA: nucleotide sugar dehydrogenase [Polyangiaceae bacterium]|jgi:UDPglucose 6-dehydrogenase
MNVCVYGLWHLGSVTAACLADWFPTIGLDPDGSITAALSEGRPPLFEPGLAELVRQGLSSGKLAFTSDLARVASADLVWVTFDTPVNQDDVADPDFVATRIQELFPHLRDGSVVLVSSQVPVGFCAKLEHAFSAVADGRQIEFACSPENLRLGRAIEVFRKPERVIVGVRGAAARSRLTELLAPLNCPIQWLGVESAEMTKHALNAFLATSVAFINEIATACEATGADAKEVESALKSEGRIGPKAYLSPGGAFAGGTLARDIAFLLAAGSRLGFATPLLAGVKQSNDVHRGWARRRLAELLGELRGKNIAVLGLTYKPDTDTLRRSEAVELCRWLGEQGAHVRAFDPVVKHKTSELPAELELCARVDDALRGAEAVVIATQWPVFRELTSERIAAASANPLVLDANRFLAGNLAGDARLRYLAVGAPRREK